MALPDSGDVRTIVVIVHGSGPNTYLNKRPGFNYFDVLADGFCEQGVGFYTYDRRGCEVGDKPPFFVRIDTVKYRRYTPQQDTLDVESHITSIRNDGRFRDCKILLYGISEGTIIAPLVAERGNVPVDGLLLHGYANENMYDIVVWQNEGSNSMIVLNALFDKDGDGAISPQEYGADDLAPYRKQLFQNQPFDSTDVVKNGFLDVEDIPAILERAVELMDCELAIVGMELEHPELFADESVCQAPDFGLHLAAKPRNLGIVGIAEIVVCLWLSGEIVGMDGKPVSLIRLAEAFEYLLGMDFGEYLR